MENNDLSSQAKEIGEMQNDIKYLRDMIVAYVQQPRVDHSATYNNELSTLKEELEQLKNNLQKPQVVEPAQNNDELSDLKKELELLRNSIQRHQVVQPVQLVQSHPVTAAPTRMQPAVQEHQDERALAIQRTEIRYTVFYLGSALFALAALRIIVTK